MNGIKTKLNKEEIIKKIKEKSRWVFRETLKIHSIAPETRLASSLSDIELFCTLYYGQILNFDADNLLWEDRDRFIISKGHGSISMYPILADSGFFSTDELQRVGKEGSFLGGIPDPVIPGYETVNGSLGHGLGVSSGIAIALKRKGLNSNVFVMVGDGELYEGANWEAVMFAAHHRLDNIVLIVDYNAKAMLDYTSNIVDLSNLPAIFESFGWDVIEVDGHDVESLYDVFSGIKNKQGRPKAVIAHTVKGKGVPEFEKSPLCHILSIKPERIKEILDNED